MDAATDTSGDTGRQRAWVGGLAPGENRSDRCPNARALLWIVHAVMVELYSHLQALPHSKRAVAVNWSIWPSEELPSGHTCKGPWRRSFAGVSGQEQWWPVINTKMGLQRLLGAEMKQ